MQDNKEEIQKKIEIFKKQKARLELEIKYLEIDLKLVDNLKKSSIEKNKELVNINSFKILSEEFEEAVNGTFSKVPEELTSGEEILDFILNN